MDDKGKTEKEKEDEKKQNGKEEENNKDEKEEKEDERNKNTKEQTEAEELMEVDKIEGESVNMLSEGQCLFVLFCLFVCLFVLIMNLNKAVSFWGVHRRN